MGSMVNVAVSVLGAIFFIHLIACEFLDTIGRLEIIEKKWPRLYRAMSNRPMRLVLLIFLIALVAKDIHDRVEEKAPTLNVTVQAPPAPTIQMVQYAPSGSPHKEPVRTVVQNGNGNAANPGTITAPITQGPCGVIQNGGSNNSASPTCGTPQREIRPDQKDKILAELGPEPLTNLRILCDLQDSETCKYGRQIARILKVDQVIPDVHGEIPGNLILVISPKDIAAPPVAALRLRQAFKAAGIIVPIEHEADDDPIGHGNTELFVANALKQQ